MSQKPELYIPANEFDVGYQLGVAHCGVILKDLGSDVGSKYINLIAKKDYVEFAKKIEKGV